MPTDTGTLIGLGVAAVVVLWLVFAMMRKLFGIALIIALAAGAWYLWSNPEAQRTALDMIGL
jgi:uncharacterized membrane protein YccC